MTDIESLRARLFVAENERDKAQIALAKIIRNPDIETAVRRQEQDADAYWDARERLISRIEELSNRLSYGRVIQVAPGNEWVEVSFTSGVTQKFVNKNRVDEIESTLLRIINGPWPDSVTGPEEQCQFDADVARNALMVCREPDFGSTKPVEDLSALVQRLVRRLRKAAPDYELSNKAMDYLRRNGRLGSPLRD